MTPEYMKVGGKLYQLVNHYCLPDDGWSVELTEMGENGGGLLHVLIPDEDADRPCEVPLSLLRFDGHLWCGGQAVYAAS
ncbi:hypothetical protein [Streptosporangium lutulentum]|uniref:Uncharacterized protein n=1 Tax=Streptosporangium lutulentum TaxID=1461250 RepID=A0ABT9QAB7_9ACTN|nr:hypothetical protein [Streptosporangium lutulentum]MDP9843592.1 hypothetical protein [Streptosporangium lutulentum]